MLKFMIASAAVMGAVRLTPVGGPTPGNAGAAADAALLADATEIANSLGVSPQEAARRLRAQAILGAHLSQLREVHRGRIAGIYYQHQPDFRVVVRLKGSEPAWE